MTRDTSPAMRGLEGIDIAVTVAVIGGLGFAAWIGAYGPTAPIPMHMQLDGTIDRWGDRSEAALVLAVVAATLGATHGLTASIVRTRPMPEGARRGLWFGQLIGLAVCLMVMGLIGSLALGAGDPARDAGAIARGVTVFLAIVMLVIGGMLGKTAPNPWVGVRTYWSLTSRLAWDKSNRLLGRLWFWLGLVGLPTAFVAPVEIGSIGIAAAMVLSGAWAVFESWRVWMGDPERRVA